MASVRFLALSLLAASLLLAARSAATQEAAAAYPSRGPRIVVPFAAGGLPDIIARLVARRLSEQLQQQFIVDNRPGAGGIIGAEHVAKSTGDGYTLLIADVGQWAINPAMYSKLPYDPLKHFVPVSRIGSTPLFMVIGSRVPAATLAELAAIAKSTHGGLNYGSSGTGSIHHLIFETLRAQTGIPLTHVPYKGSGQVVPALLAGEVAVMLAAFPTVATHVKTGQVRLLAVVAAKRAAQAPEVPTLAELGVAGMEFPVDIGLLAPAGTPRPIVAKLAGELRLAVQHPEVAQRFAAGSVEPLADSPESYAAVIKADIEKYARAVKISGAKVD
jgi:tripartite-type tricarboxylate transporter receptor subunit TctC